MPSPAGALVVLAAGLMLVAGRLASVVILQDFSLPLMLAGLVLLLLGWAYLKALAPVIGYLVFMIPLFAEGSASVNWPFQLLSANIGIWVLQLLGLSAYRDAQFILLPTVTLEVADVCSGVRFLLYVVAVGLPLAYVMLGTWGGERHCSCSRWSWRCSPTACGSR